ncbi:MAG: hypothetical protein P8Z79_21410, partial [Sedimentisphaerales bacterium]
MVSNHATRYDICRPLGLLVLIAAFVSVASSTCSARVSENLLTNPTFEEGVDADGLPVGWSLYGGRDTNQHISLVQLEGSVGTAVKMVDGDSSAEIGLMQTLTVKPSLTYEASVETRGIEGAASDGAYLQLRFLPSEKYVQMSLDPSSTKAFERVSVKGTAPPGTERATVYLYTHAGPTPSLLLRDARLVSGVSPPPAAPPDPIPPVYTKLKDLHITTELVHQGRPNITIIVPASGIYDEPAKRIREWIAGLTDAEVPIMNDHSSAGAVPVKGHLIVLGNRSTNQTISELYNRYYTLLDLRYPGRGGHVVRTLHNPFGDGHNVIFVGASDSAGVDAAADVLIRRLKETGISSDGTLSVGWLADIKLGEGIHIPTNLRKFETWEASEGYGSVGYFGWNSLSKRMAMYYMTGDPFQAREFIRLAFPDEKARAEIAAIDGERIENKDEPLSGPYHYNAHMMILFWDLIEESPVFSDEERLRVTNAFSKQLLHRKGEGIYGRTTPPAGVGSRHGQWSAISLYCLGRYFQKDYPNSIWQHCVESAKMHFAPLHKHAWVSGENDNLFWYDTGIAPIFTYLLLSGDRVPVENGVLKTLLRGQEMLISGRRPDWALRSASIGYLHKAAYLMRDGRYIRYRQRTGVDVNIFRLGQSFWPGNDLKPEPPKDLVGKWSINHLPRPMWRARHSGLHFDESFLFGSYRSAPDASGDFILIDGFNGASRNPYHTFAILELRLDGRTLLEGYRNQVFTRADGLVEPHIAMDAALKYQKVLGKTAIVVAEVPDAPYCNWRRTLVQPVQRYALVVDDLAFRTDSNHLEVQIQWETARAPEAFEDGHIEFDAATEAGKPGTQGRGQVWPADLMTTTCKGRIATMQWLGRVRKGEHRYFFSLVGDQGASVGSVRLAGNAAALALPSPALATMGEFQGIKAELAILAKDHLYAKGLVRFAPELAEEPRGAVHLDAGEHVFEKAKPSEQYMAKLPAYLDALLMKGRQKRSLAMAEARSTVPAKAPLLTATMTASVGRKIADLITIPSLGGSAICAAEGKNIHLLSSDGNELRVLKADGAVRMLHWWPAHRLLLAGCADEQVIAFDESGKRQWVFTSEMDPAVYRAAKTYWFKSAPGHGG